MIAIGIGCRKGCAEREIVGLVKATTALLPKGCQASGLFTVAEKRGDPALEAAATALGVPLNYLELEALRPFAREVQTHSSRVEDMFGVPSIAETAALAGAGEGAVLLVPRKASAAATCAIAGSWP